MSRETLFSLLFSCYKFTAFFLLPVLFVLCTHLWWIRKYSLLFRSVVSILDINVEVFHSFKLLFLSLSDLCVTSITDLSPVRHSVEKLTTQDYKFSYGCALTVPKQLTNNPINFSIITWYKIAFKIFQTFQL